MKQNILLIAAPLFVALLLLWGCETTDPGSPSANQAPETWIVVAPLDDALHDHYISPSVMFHVQWFGHDEDGQVVGYYIQIDDGPEAWTTRGDSAIAFEASTPDPNNPGQTQYAAHTIKVASIDNEGLRDPEPATRTFAAMNDIPEITAFVADFPRFIVQDGDTMPPVV